MADIPTMAEYIFRRATQLGVDPNLALGIAMREGLNDRTINSPTFGNVDNRGYSFGPFQLFSGSRDPRSIAPGGMAYEFQQRFNAPPRLDNWQQQVDFSLERMRDRGVGAWYSVRDAGGVEPITQIGRQAATRFGLGLPPNEPTEALPTPVPGIALRPPALPQPAAPPPAPAPQDPVYASDLGTGLRRLGNFLAPGLVDPATPLTPEQQQQERERNEALAATERNQQGAQRAFAALAAQGAGQETPQLALRPQVGGMREFQPLQPFAPMRIRRRGLLD